MPTRGESPSRSRQQQLILMANRSRKNPARGPSSTWTNPHRTTPHKTTRPQDDSTQDHSTQDHSTQDDAVLDSVPDEDPGRIDPTSPPAPLIEPINETTTDLLDAANALEKPYGEGTDLDSTGLDSTGLDSPGAHVDEALIDEGDDAPLFPRERRGADSSHDAPHLKRRIDDDVDASIDPGMASTEINDLTAELAGSQFDEADGSTAIVPEGTDADVPVQVENPPRSEQIGDQGIEPGPPDLPGEHGEPLGSLIEDAKPETTAADEADTSRSAGSGQHVGSSDDRIPTLPKRSGFGLSRMLAAAQTVFTEDDDPEAEASSNPDDEGLPEELPSWAITDDDGHSSDLVASFESLSDDKAEVASEPSVLEPGG